MGKLILLTLCLVGIFSCTPKDPQHKVLCEEQDCVEDVTAEVRRHSRW